MFSNIAIRAKNLFKKQPPQPKEPRKKIEIQLKSVKKQFENQIKKLEEGLDDANISINQSTKLVGRQILQSAYRFQEIQIAKIIQNRLKSLPSSLIDPTDLSLWAIWQMKNLTAEMYQFESSI